MKTPILLSAIFLIALSSCSKKITPTKSEDGPVTYHIVDKIEKPSKKGKVKPVAEIKKGEQFFKVTGLERFWELEMSTETIKFISTNEGESFSVPYVKPIQAADSDVKLYRSKANDNEIELTILDTKCSDELAGMSNTTMVRVAIKRAGEEKFTVLKGCGVFLPDVHLNVVWTLRQIKLQKVVPLDFGNELPYLDLHVAISQFTGFGGCNRIKGQLAFAENNQMQFREVISTRMMCQGGNREVSFLNALNASNRFEIKENMLYLFNGKDLQLVFSRS